MDSAAFYKLLSDSHDSHDIAIIPTNQPMCLLTKTSCTANYISLPCTHTFNYSALVADIRNNKSWTDTTTWKNCADALVSKKTHIQCPYCRQYSKGLLPYYPIDSIVRINGVNSPQNKQMATPHECEWVGLSGKNRGIRCDGVGYTNDTTAPNPTYYCTKHHRHTTKATTTIPPVTYTTCQAIIRHSKNPYTVCGVGKNCVQIGGGTEQYHACKMHLKYFNRHSKITMIPLQGTVCKLVVKSHDNTQIT